MKKASNCLSRRRLIVGVAASAVDTRMGRLVGRQVAVTREQHKNSLYVVLGDRRNFRPTASIEHGRLVPARVAVFNTALSHRQWKWLNWTAPGADSIASFVGVVALNGIALGIRWWSPPEQNPGLKIAIFLPIVGNPAFARDLVSGRFGKFVAIYGGKIAYIPISAA